MHANDPDSHPDPDALLARIEAEAERAHQGRLKIFFGACPGVGKTYAMLNAARTMQGQGVEVVVARPFQVDAIVVLPEHLHCIWRMPEGDADFSSRWREIKKAASRQIDTSPNSRNERPVWQRRYWEHAIRDEEDWRRHVDYIHYNPVKHGLVNQPGEWSWSSFGSAVAKGW